MSDSPGLQFTPPPKKKAGRPRDYAPCRPDKLQHHFNKHRLCSWCKRSMQELKDALKEPVPTVTALEQIQQLERQAKPQYHVHLRNPESYPKQFLLVRDPHKRKLVRAGRRGGKTTAAGIIAVEQFLKGRRVLYAAPTADQLNKFWREVKRALVELIEYGAVYKNETEHIIEFRGTEQRIRAKTAWNADTLRGDYADVLILDEYQMMDETAWTIVGQPMLIDNNGDAILIYTPPSLATKSVSKASDKRHAAKMFKVCEQDPRWLCIHFASHDNPHISEQGLAEVAKDMSKLAYRQEILAEDTDEVPGALWTLALIEKCQIEPALVPPMRRIVIGVDPSGSTTTEVGIVAAGEGEDGHFYILRDRSMLAPKPKAWASTTIMLYFELAADRIIGERNYGGDMVEETVRNVDESVSYKDVVATRGKIVRAEPVVALFEQGKVHMVKGNDFDALEEELCSYVPGDKSPNRMDALVWTIIELSGQGSLGFLDWLKSGKAATFVGRHPVKMTPVPVDKTAGATNLAGVMTNDKTLQCPKCASTTVQMVAGQHRCAQCGTQWSDRKPAAAPIGGRRQITLEK